MNRYLSPILAVILLTTACDQKASSVEAAPRTVKVAQAIIVGSAQQQTSPARIESGDSAGLSFKRSGQVEPLDIRQGATLTQGQTLARLDARETQQQVNERQTMATPAQRQFDCLQTLAGHQAISQAEMDMQRVNRGAASAALRTARGELVQTSLTALFGGTAAGMHIRDHQVITIDQPAITPMRTDLFDVVFSIPENLFTSLDIRNTAYRPVVRINTLPGREFTAEHKEHTGSNDNNIFT